MKPFSLTRLSQAFLQTLSLPSGMLIDMTLGCGHDTQFLLESFPNRELLAVDIQEIAIVRAKERLGETLSQKVTFYLGCHSSLGSILGEKEIALAMFNLGFLPGSDKSITTKAKSTLDALEFLKDRMKSEGVISLLLYVGHPGGEKEALAVKTLLKNWDSSEWMVWEMARLNENELKICKKNRSPIWIIIKKL